MPHGPHSRTWEARWRHAGNREDVPVQTDLVTDDVGPAGEARPPQLAADDDDRMPTWGHIVGGRKESPAVGSETEHVEKVAADQIAEGAIRAVAGIQADGESRPCRHAVEQVSTVAKRGVHRIREGTAVLLALHVDQSIAIGYWQALQQCGVDDAKDGGVGADAERECQDRRERDGWLLPQRAGGIAEVLPEISEQVSGGSPRRNGFWCVRLSQRRELSCEQIPLPEPGKRLRRRFVLRRPARHQFPPAILEMLRQLLDDLVLTGRRQAQ